MSVHSSLSTAARPIPAKQPIQRIEHNAPVPTAPRTRAVSMGDDQYIAPHSSPRRACDVASSPGDADGRRMAAVMAELRESQSRRWALRARLRALNAAPTLDRAEHAEMKKLRSELRRITGRRYLDFVPSIRSLNVALDVGSTGSARQRFEVFFGREAQSQRWFVTPGEQHGVQANADDCDIAMHTHVATNFRSTRMESGLPSWGDILASAGLPARTFVISRSGLVEWSTDIRFAKEPERRLSRNAGEEEEKAWFKQINRWLTSLDFFYRRQLKRVNANPRDYGWCAATDRLSQGADGGFLAPADRAPGLMGLLRSLFARCRALIPDKASRPG